MYRKRRTNSVVSPSPWSVNTVLLVTVFVVTSGVVYYWGRVAQSPSQPLPVAVEFASPPHETQRGAKQIYAAAAAAAEQARLQWQLAESARQQYVDRYLKQEQTEAQQAASTPVPPAPTTTARKPARTENPTWARLNQSFRKLEQQRSQLLIERTPAHPEVQEVSGKLAEAEQALAATPRWLPLAPPKDESTVSQAALPSPNAAQSALAAQQAAQRQTRFRMELTRLNRQADEARRQYEQLAAAERDAWSACVKQHEPRPAPPPAVATASADATGNVLLSTALLAGMAMMVGVGMFAAGASMEPAVKSASQVSSLLGMPVVATVTLPGLRPPVSGRHRGWLRLASCLGGTILMAGCIGLVYRAVAG